MREERWRGETEKERENKRRPDRKVGENSERKEHKNEIKVGGKKERSREERYRDIERTRESEEEAGVKKSWKEEQKIKEKHKIWQKNIIRIKYTEKRGVRTTEREEGMEKPKGENSWKE